MPYINKATKDLVDITLKPESAGELNYAIHLLLERYMDYQGESYQTYNDMIGALEGAKLELYRRRVAGYENKKIEQNGDINFYGQ